MSDFSVSLDRLIREGNLDTEPLARRAGVPHGMLVKYRKGKAVPERAVFQRLLFAMPLTMEEQRLLSHSYYVSSIGEWTYLRRSYLQKQLSELAQMMNALVAGGTVLQAGGAAFPTMPEADIRVFHSSYDAERVLTCILNEEISREAHPLVCTNVLLQQDMLHRVLLERFLNSGGRLELRHILPFTKDTGRDLNNLKALFSALPFCIAPGGAYHPWLYYCGAPLYADRSAPFAFYLYTHRRLLWISEDLETVALISNAGLLEAYRERFERAVQLCRPLLYRPSSAEQMLAASTAFYSSGEPYQTFALEPQPCLGPFLTEEMLERSVNREMPGTDELANALFHHYASISACMTGMTSICWERGLALFIDEGRFCPFPPSYARPFSPRDRLTVLQSLYQGVQEGRIEVYFVNEALFPFTEGFSLHCQGARRFAFEMHDDSTQMYANIIFEEQSLCGAFYDFIQSMPDGEWVYGREESLLILERGIARCEALCAQEAETQGRPVREAR